ncbi:MAG: riboflavin synthase subunit alpha [Gammaproteobacteria bacterium]|jgi:riboflavin synthase|nr:MAG: riboflavin synthase subunit alpha [Gammaproteobacteria bacterium]
MFTGIVQGYCPVLRVEKETNLSKVAIELNDLAESVALGASVAVNGTCLTVTGEEPGGVLTFDIIQETLDLTNLSGLAAGDMVNVERSFRVGDEVGGHILSGHVADTVEVARIVQADNLRTIHFSVPGQWMKYLNHKGFVALDGASLTIASIDREANEISVSLIPETIERTSLGRVLEGARVNLEVDAQTQAIVETVERLIDTPEMIARMAVHAGKRD